jgi:hypothetical protein
MSWFEGSLARKAVLVGIMAIGMTSTAFAQTVTPATGLGQAWPNATDVSSSPHWHVYVFRLNGIKYIQINDLSGAVHAAVGTASGVSIVLPTGVDAQRVRTDALTMLKAATSGPATQTVYRDTATTVTATPQTDGTTIFTVTAICQDPYNCGGGRGG